jgi:hypothetical protein
MTLQTVLTCPAVEAATFHSQTKIEKREEHGSRSEPKGPNQYEKLVWMDEEFILHRFLLRDKTTDESGKN